MSKNQCLRFKINSCNILTQDILCVAYGNHTTAGKFAKLLCVVFLLSVEGTKVIKSLFDLSESLRS